MMLWGGGGGGGGGGDYIIKTPPHPDKLPLLIWVKMENRPKYKYQIKDLSMIILFSFVSKRDS